MRLARTLILVLAATAACTAAHATHVTIEVKTAAGAAAVNAVVVVDAQTAVAAPARDRAVVDQVNKQFDPQINIVRTGSTIVFPNHDQIHHQVYSFSDAKRFELDLYAGSRNASEVFDKPGLVVLGCNIHDRMLAFVAVVDTPYFAKLSATGTGDFDLPPGRYTVSAWHPELGAVRKQTLNVEAAPANMTLTLAASPDYDPVAAWPETGSVSE
jgi:plastocyanin